jgi:hypothetical protein
MVAGFALWRKHSDLSGFAVYLHMHENVEADGDFIRRDSESCERFAQIPETSAVRV